MDTSRQTFTGVVEEVALFPKTRFSKTVGEADVIPLGVKATVNLGDGRRIYVETSCGEIVEVEHGKGYYQAPQDQRWPWAIPAGDGYVPVIWAGDTIMIEGHVKFEKTSKKGNPYLVVNRTKVLSCLKEEQPAPGVWQGTQRREILIGESRNPAHETTPKTFPLTSYTVPAPKSDLEQLADSMLAEFS